MSDLRVKLILELLDRITSPFQRLANNFTQASVRMMHAAERLQAKVKAIGEAAQKVGQALSVSLSLPITAFGIASVRASAQMESLFASLQTAVGNTEAPKVLQEIQKFAATTPFELEEVLQGYIRLKNLGLDPSIKSLTSFGNTAGSMNKNLMQFIEAVADATTGEFERLKEFGIKASVEGKKVSFVFQGQKTTIKNSAAEIQKYLENIGNVNFAGGMEKQASTLNGIMSNLSDNTNAALTKIGNSVVENLDLKNFFRDLGEAINYAADCFTALPAPIQKFIVITAVILAVIGPAIIAISQFAIGIASLIYTATLLAPTMIVLAGLFKAFAVALLTTPIGWIIAGVAALAAAAYTLMENWDVVGPYFEKVWSGIKAIFKEGVDWALNILKPLMGAIDLVSASFQVIKSKFGGDPVTAAMPSLPSVTSGSSSASGSPAAQSIMFKDRVDTGGTLHIKIDSEGGAKTVMSRPNDENMNYLVDTGLMMGVR